MNSNTANLVIFDCDGVLVDSEPLANRVFGELLETIGLRLSVEQVMQTFVGRTKAGCVALAEELAGRKVPEGFGERWDAALFETFARELKSIEGVEALLGGMRLPYCVASNSSPKRMQVSLTAAGLLKYFEGRMFSSVEVAKPKPAPDLFLHAAARMGFEPARCVVVEDTPTGVRAAVAAGMVVFGYAGAAHTSVEALRAEGARTFAHMSELPGLLQ